VIIFPVSSDTAIIANGMGDYQDKFPIKKWFILKYRRNTGVAGGKMKNLE
jgi:hypothetical protein